MDLFTTPVKDAQATHALWFLGAFHPEGPWVLTAIHPETGDIETRTFLTGEEGPAAEWIARKNEQHNVYFSVNSPGRRLSKKATREDIYVVPWLHADIDARAGEPLDQEIERIRLLLTERCPTLPPTVIIFSGGGYQAFWKLQEPIETGGHLEAAEDVARYNRQLVNALDGDITCPNADRIMRLPGTTNFPTPKKRARGRVPAQAEVYSFNEDLVYPLSKYLSKQLSKRHFEKTFTPGSKNYASKSARFQGNKLCHDPEQFRILHDEIRKNPDLAIGGVTWGWLNAAFESIDILKDETFLQNIKTPVLILGAENDAVVSLAAQEKLSRKLSHGEFHCIEGAFHELMFETPRIREKLWSLFDRFMREESKGF